MPDDRRVVLTTVVVGLLAVGHALVTWPLGAVVALFVGGAAIAFAAEAVGVRLGWVEHHIGPKLLGVPLYALPGWTAVIYAALRVALLVADGPAAVGLAAGLATAYDVLTDHLGVAAGHWTYAEGLPGPRLRGVPWWNFAGWLVVSAATAALALPFR